MVAMAVGVVVVAGEAGRVITIALAVATGRTLMPMCTPSLLCIQLCAAPIPMIIQSDHLQLHKDDELCLLGREGSMLG